jgi:hypothetical protein
MYRKFDWISISRRSCFSTFDETSSCLCITLRAHTNPVLFSCARYTLPNLPFPKGFPISNILKWNSLGGGGAVGMDCATVNGPDFREFSNSSESPECLDVCVERQWDAETLITVTDCWEVDPKTDFRGFIGAGALLNV